MMAKPCTIQCVPLQDVLQVYESRKNILSLSVSKLQEVIKKNSVVKFFHAPISNIFIINRLLGVLKYFKRKINNVRIGEQL